MTPAQLASIDGTYYSRDIWEGTSKSSLSPAAVAFWKIIESAPNLKWLAVFSSGTDQVPYQQQMQRGVLVQPSVYGTDNTAMLDALRAKSFPFRGVAVIEESITDRELEDMHTAGVRGVRINLAAQTPGLKLEQAPAFKDVPQLARAAVATAPDRTVWGTDWPHPMGKEMMPNDGDLADMLADWVPDEAQRKKVLVDNPARLYGF